MKSIGVLMANTFVDKRKKYGKEDGGSVNPIRPCVDEYQFSPTSLETTFFLQPGCSQRKAKRGIINNLPRPQNFPHPMGPPATSFVLLTNPVLAVFLIHCHKNGAFAQICKVESEQMPGMGKSSWNCCKTPLDSHYDRFSNSRRTPYFTFYGIADIWEIAGAHPLTLAGWKIIQLSENAANLGLIC